jgi:hypothetical protein
MNIKDLPRCSGHNKQGQPCGQVAMGNGKCQFHGGKSTGSPKGARNALKTGAYVTVLKAEDKVRFKALMNELGKLDSEITLMRFRLESILRQQEKWAQDHPDGTGLEEVERVEVGDVDMLEENARMTAGDFSLSGLDTTEGMELEQFQNTEVGLNPGRTVTLRKPDFDSLILRYEAAISRDEERRAKLLMNGELKDAVERLNNLEEKMKGQADGKEEGSTKTEG